MCTCMDPAPRVGGEKPPASVKEETRFCRQALKLATAVKADARQRPRIARRTRRRPQAGRTMRHAPKTSKPRRALLARYIRASLAGLSHGECCNSGARCI